MLDPASPFRPAVSMRGYGRAAAEAAAIGIAAALAVFALFYWLAAASLHIDRAALARPVTAAFANGALDPAASWQHGNTEIGSHQYNDCLILFQAMDDRAPARLRAVSPLSVPIETDNSCAALQALTVGQAPATTRFYHQYLHGHTTLARWLVPQLGVAGLRGLYKLLASLLLLAGIGYALLGLARGPRVGEAGAWLAIFVVFARWYGLESFGQSLGHGPADLMILTFLLFLARGSANRPLGAGTVMIGAALFGALTMAFEFLTGGLPLGLAIILGAVPLALSGGGEQGRALLRAVVAFVVAAGATMAAKLLMVVALFPAGALTVIEHQLLFRVGLEQAARRETAVGGREFVTHLWAGLEGLASGMQLLVLGSLLIALVAGGWGYRRLRAAGPAERFRASALAGSLLVPPLWLVLFWQHSAEHAWFMDRILTWDIAGGMALFALALRQPASE
ncbi:hypothetical protein [uncultured Sphingomonas sp.]|uniref:hypothetical protein n=1 Tax=uncultured Sphingomonas sp. TaxID=158754 RepID=UPI002588BD8E|nr:hypothetical protein [uncultured Sphingomonas sp.]